MSSSAGTHQKEEKIKQGMKKKSLQFPQSWSFGNIFLKIQMFSFLLVCFVSFSLVLCLSARMDVAVEMEARVYVCVYMYIYLY